MTSEFLERTIELNVISASDLKKVKNLGHQNCYAVAYIYHNRRRQTEPDRVGELNPVWHKILTLECEEELLRSPKSFLTVEIRCHGTLREKLVGTVTVRLDEMMALQSKETAPGHAMSFDVYRPSGKVHGSLVMGVRFGEVRSVQRYRSQQTPVGYTGRPQYAHQGYGGMYPQTYGQGYGMYPQMQGRARKPRAGFGAGLLGGALGGLLVGDMIDDAYDDCGDYGDMDMDMDFDM